MLTRPFAVAALLVLVWLAARRRGRPAQAAQDVDAPGHRRRSRRRGLAVGPDGDGIQDVDAGLRQGHAGPDRRLLRARRREPLLRVPGVRQRAQSYQGVDRGARRRQRRRLDLHQPRFLRRPAVALRALCEPAGHPGRQPVRGGPRGLRLRRGVVQRRPHRQPGLHHRGADSLQEPPLRRREPRAHGAHLRAPGHAAVRTGHLPAARPEGRAELPDPEHRRSSSPTSATTGSSRSCPTRCTTTRWSARPNPSSACRAARSSA